MFVVNVTDDGDEAGVGDRTCGSDENVEDARNYTFGLKLSNHQHYKNINITPEDQSRFMLRTWIIETVGLSFPSLLR
ncbi:hypothetical protein ElyMa_000454500 [Elysia marginata]|uniref:Uncharacterized protein n=1 Tax=Elysia marginata TaxID=1093978 RepID=A0AAV4FQX9_9GAST|nr:hypothetical protein ElyMa_000454500 [Elysia marginata]